MQLTRAGEPGDEVFLIVDGTARAEVSAEKHVLPTVVADAPGRLLVISRRHFAVLLKGVPGLTETLLVTLSRRVRQAEERAERLGSP